MRKYLIAAILAAFTLPAAPALAEKSDRHGRKRHGEHYDSRGHYHQPRAIGHDDHVWRGKDGRYYCRRDNGTTGLIIGGALGALAGRQLDGGRDRTLGTILGAAGGGLLGREIDRGNLRCS